MIPVRSLRIAVVGDVHDQWQEVDHEMLHHLAVDLVLFVGDFGNESVPVVQAIASLDIPKAIIFGNHDAWYSASEWGKKKCPYDRRLEDRVQKQLDLVGAAHVGYGRLDLPQFDLAVVGSRPFSWGGKDWKNAEFYQTRFGVKDFVSSTARIMTEVEASPHSTILFLGHNGPLGLGDRPEAPCGKDWQPLGGDYGDPDFAEAIAQTRSLPKQVPLVVFGHMHHKLRHSPELRQSLQRSAGTIYLNAATVPRILVFGDREVHNFAIVELADGIVCQVSLVWLDLDLQLQKQIFL
jgi:uncharacterized protein (TIGR04168 family)